MRPFARADPATLTPAAGLREESLRLFGLVLTIKYAEISITALGLLAKRVLGSGGSGQYGDYPTLLLIADICAIPVVWALVRWTRRSRPLDGALAMAGILVHALLLISGTGLRFANHYLLQAAIGVVGVLAAGRQCAGDRAEPAWAPMTWLGVVVWGLAGMKKFIGGSYLDGEFLAYLAGEPRERVFVLLSRGILGDDRASVPAQCCVQSHIGVSKATAYVFVAAGIGMAIAEVSPVLMALIAPRRIVGWAMFALAVVATGIADELDFGLALIALAALWGEGRAFRRLAVLTAAAMAAGWIWRVLR